MKTRLLLMILLPALLGSANAGTIAGLVRAQGKEQAEANGAGGKYTSRKYSFAERVNYEEIHDFIVYIDGPAGPKTAPPQKPVQVVTTKRITQKGAMFTPSILPVLVGTTIEWPNHDDIYHNVFSISEPKPFDLGLYKDPEVKRITFDKPGRVEAFCSIHSAMNCTILVLENPFFATTDAHGKYMLPDVPAGVHSLKAWHKRLPAQTRQVTVPESGELKVDFTMGITNLPQY
jgi:plastocyanin